MCCQKLNRSSHPHLKTGVTFLTSFLRVFGSRMGQANITDLFSALEKVPLWCKTLTQNSQSTNRAVFTTQVLFHLRKSSQECKTALTSQFGTPFLVFWSYRLFIFCVCLPFVFLSRHQSDQLSSPRLNSRQLIFRRKSLYAAPSYLETLEKKINNLSNIIFWWEHGSMHIETRGIYKRNMNGRRSRNTVGCRSRNTDNHLQLCVRCSYFFGGSQSNFLLKLHLSVFYLYMLLI